MKVKLKNVNDMVVSDENITVMILKKPKRRYRTIIRAYYKKRLHKKYHYDNDEKLEVCRRCAYYMISCDGSNYTFCDYPEDED